MNVNWNYYFSLCEWTLHQAICLVNGIEPNNFIEQWQFGDNKSLIKHEYKRILNSNLNADDASILVERFDMIKNQYVMEMKENISMAQLCKKTDAFGHTEFDGNSILVKPLAFIKWINNKKFIDNTNQYITDMIEKISQEQLRKKTEDIEFIDSDSNKEMEESLKFLVVG